MLKQNVTLDASVVSSCPAPFSLRFEVSGTSSPDETFVLTVQLIEVNNVLDSLDICCIVGECPPYDWGLQDTDPSAGDDCGLFLLDEDIKKCRVL